MSADEDETATETETAAPDSGPVVREAAPSRRYAAWAARLEGIREQGRYRFLRTLLPTGPTRAILDGREVIVACSNDYLGLAHQHPARGRGSTSSRLIAGTRPSHQTLEAELEAWLERPTLVFPSGYHANLAVFSTVCIAGQKIASDALNHASIIDGMRLARAERVIVDHADPTAIPGDVDLVAVEGLFSMDGDVPPLAHYPVRPWLAVDEAHAIGCLGPEGRGAAAAAGRTPDILIGTFGKAFGGAGAFVAGPPELKELLVNAGRSFIYTTALADGLASSALRALRTLRNRPELREQLAANAIKLRRALTQRGWTVLGDHHIVPVLTREHTMAVADRLLQADVFAPAIRAPTVAPGQERIRLTVSAAHTTEDLERIADAFGLPPG